MEYMSALEISRKWGVSKRRVQLLCSKNRIEGVVRVGNMWLIPKDATKPFDARYRCRTKCENKK